MARFYGKVGYVITKKTSPGIFEEEPVERTHMGEVNRGISQWTPSEGVNDDLKLNVQISIVGDQFANEHCQSIKYVEYMGAKWKVTSVDPQHPRLILTIGGVYNGQ